MLQETVISLSHPLNTNTPMYGGRKGLSIHLTSDIQQGDHCTCAKLTLPNHIGTHVDVPAHFIKNGKVIGDYKPREWCFSHIKLIDVPTLDCKLIGPKNLPMLSQDSDLEILLIRTGYEQLRGARAYWSENPGFLPSVATYLKQHYRHLKAIGFDFISLTSFQNRLIGREAHAAFLSHNIRIFEDVSLKNIQGKLTHLIALPLPVLELDGAPCNIIAWEKYV